MIKTYFRQVIGTSEIKEILFDESHEEEFYNHFGTRPTNIKGNGLTSFYALWIVNKWNKNNSYKYWVNVNI